MIKYPDCIFYGKPVMIMHKGYCKQKKTSRCRLLNFIYRILYGEEFIFLRGKHFENNSRKSQRLL